MTKQMMSPRHRYPQ